MDREYVGVHECGWVAVCALFFDHCNHWKANGISCFIDIWKKKFKNLFTQKVLNLFIALLLSSFSAQNLQEGKEEEENKIQEAIDRIANFFKWFWEKIFCCHGSKKQSEKSLDENPKDENDLDDSNGIINSWYF